MVAHSLLRDGAKPHQGKGLDSLPSCSAGIGLDPGPCPRKGAAARNKLRATMNGLTPLGAGPIIPPRRRDLSARLDHPAFRGIDVGSGGRSKLPGQIAGVRLPFAILLSIAAVAALLLGGADAPAVEAPMSTAKPLEAPLVPGPRPDLDLLFTAQVAGWIEPCG